MRLFNCACLVSLLYHTNLFVNALPHIAHAAAKPVDSDQTRANAVKNAFLHAWSGYSQFAYGHDELLPVNNKFSDSRNGWGATIIDGLDTAIIMGLSTEYQKAIGFVDQINWSQSLTESKTFETCIRYMGGLISAYELLPDPRILKKLDELVQQVVLPAFDTPNGIPAPYVNVSTHTPNLSRDEVILAEVALQVELVRYSQITGDPKYEQIGNSIIGKVANASTPIPGLYSIQWSRSMFMPKNGVISIGGGGDSFYEYLLKTNMLMGGKEELQLNMWKTAVDSMMKHLRSVSTKGDVYLAESISGRKILKSGELLCFLPGNILLGAHYLGIEEYKTFATELMDSCFKLWYHSPTGLSPEVWGWIERQKDGDDGFIKNHLLKQQKKRQYNMDEDEDEEDIPILEDLPPFGHSFPESIDLTSLDKGYQLRPETIESLFYFYRLTGDRKYQDMAWNIFEAIEKYCKTESGYSSTKNVTDRTQAQLDNFQESFFFAETLKYLYLIFSDPSLLSLDEYVFNTEAHPFKLQKPIKIQK